MALAVTRPGMLGAWAIVGGSFFLSIMFPTIFALGLKGLGENTKLAGSMLVMAIVGGAFSRWCSVRIARPHRQHGAGIHRAARLLRRGLYLRFLRTGRPEPSRHRSRSQARSTL